MKRDDFREKVSHGTLMFPLAGYRWYGEFEYTVNTHWHKEIEIIFFESGIFQFSCNANEYIIEAPALAFVDAGVMHSLSLKKGQRESALVFDCRMLRYEWYDEAQSRIIEPILNQKLKLPPLIFPKDEIWSEVLNLYKKALSESEKGSASSNLRVKLYLTELLSLLYDYHYLISTEDKWDTDANQLENVKKAISYVKENYDKKIRVSDVSDYVGMSEQYFCRYFKKQLGKTLTEYINEVRIEKAAELLRNTDEKVIDIAIQCGYDNISYFIKRFKQIEGIKPLEYRRKVKE